MLVAAYKKKLKRDNFSKTFSHVLENNVLKKSFKTNWLMCRNKPGKQGQLDHIT